MLVADTSAPRWSSTGVTAATGQANNVSLTNTLTASANGDDLTQLRISGVFAKSTYTGLEAFGALIDGGGWTASGAGTAASAYGVYISAPTIATTNWSLYVASGNSVLAAGVDYNTTGVAYIGDNANANMTTGLTINQGAGGNEILTLKANDGTSVAHGMTSITETDSFATFAQAGTGGLLVSGLTEGSVGIGIKAYVTDEDDGAKSTSSSGAVRIDGLVKSGTTGTTMSANANILAVRNNTTTRFILDGDGDSHQDVGTAWTNYDDHEDAELLTALSVHVSRNDDPIRTEFGSFLTSNREKLEALKLVSFNDDGHHFVNMSKLTMLLVGAVRQQAAKYEEVLSRLNGLETRLIASGA